VEPHHSTPSFFPTAHFVAFATVAATATRSSAFAQTVGPFDSVAFTDSRLTPMNSVAFADSRLTPMNSVAFTDSRLTPIDSVAFDSQARKEPLGIEVTIGIVIGVCAAIAIFVGMIVFVIHWRSNKNGSSGSSSSAQRDRANVLVTPEVPNASAEERPSDGHLDDEEAIESLSNFNMKDVEDQPPIWI
jgi:hypothetical protein